MAEPEVMDTAARLLDRLANDAYPQVRVAVAGNPNEPWRLLASLALDATPAVRQAVLNDPAADDRALSAAAGTGCP